MPPVGTSTLERLRTEAGLTREELAVRAGVSAMTLRVCEVVGGRPANPATQKAIALALGVEPEVIWTSLAAGPILAQAA
jgi:lambda repressor-like predicted transcriptional regulator